MRFPIAPRHSEGELRPRSGRAGVPIRWTKCSDTKEGMCCDVAIQQSAPLYNGFKGCCYLKLCRALGRFGCTVFITFGTLSILAQAKSGTVEFLFC